MKTYKDYGAPTETTPGNAGDLYVDLNTGDVYECEGDQTEGKDQGFVTVYAKDITNTKYSWKLKSGSGGVSSWNDLTDRPFYEYEEEYEETVVVTEEMTVEWDGVIGDRETVDYAGMKLVHVSDCVVPSLDAVIGSTVHVSTNGAVQEATLGQDGVNEFIEDGGTAIVGANGEFASIPADNFELTFGGNSGPVFAKKGLYFCSANFDSMVVHIVKFAGVLTGPKTISGTRTVVQKIDEKYLPEPLAYEKSETVTEEMTIPFDGVIGDKESVEILVESSATPPGSRMVRVSDAVFPADGPTGNYTILGSMGGQEMPILENDEVPFYYKDDCFVAVAESMAVSVLEDNATFPETTLGNGSNRMHALSNLTFPKKGLYVLCAPDMMHISKVTGILTLAKTKIKTIDPKFLPDTIAPKELILTSSTEGSTMQFKITVTDDGTVTATEVV